VAAALLSPIWWRKLQKEMHCVRHVQWRIARFHIHRERRIARSATRKKANEVLHGEWFELFTQALLTKVVFGKTLFLSDTSFPIYYFRREIDSLCVRV
jgi:hypothetical protein